MIKTKTYTPRWYDNFAIHLFRLIIKRFLPVSWFRDPIPAKNERQAKVGNLDLEIVSQDRKSVV